MRARSRVVFVVAAIVAVTLVLSAQQQPCPPPAQPVLRWVGQSTGCTSENAVPCAAGETINFSVTPDTGGFYPGCVTYQWDFGDGANSSVSAPSHAYGINGTFFVLVRVSGGGVDVFDGKQLLVVATVVPTIQRFGASATVVRRGSMVVLSWSTKDATSVRIDPIAVTLAATVTSYSFAPGMTRTYTLTAFGSAAFRVSSPVTVVVSDGAAARGEALMARGVR
jgi:hypothetical protein